MNDIDFCLAYECPLSEVPEDLMRVCTALDDDCESCHHRCPGTQAPIY